jgi:outer membrane protein assembly factor BamE (lipoprotein component of BamABCDE complex)
MILRHGRRLVLAAAVSASFLGAACTPIRDQQGHILDNTLVQAIQPGVDNRESVAGTLGRPTFVGQFNDREWYYVSRQTRQLAFAMPRAEGTTVLRVRFDEAGNVADVSRTGLELVANVRPFGDETPTLGRQRSFFQEIFGNIGSVGGRQPGADTADNPR